MRNDGRCAAIAESKFGVGKSESVFAMLTLGTGIGGALIIDGKLFDGSTFDAGDFGHHVIRSGEDAFPCVCGKRGKQAYQRASYMYLVYISYIHYAYGHRPGCFETHASAQGLVRHYEKAALPSKVKDAEEVIQRLRSGDTLAALAVAQYLDDLSSGLANLVTFYNPSLIALGGGLAQSPEIFEDLQRMVDDKTLPATRGRVRIVSSQLGPDAGAIGAACLHL